MNFRNTLLLSILSFGFLTSCSTPDYDPSVSPARPYIPRVTMPVDLNANEQNLIGDVEQSLEQNGLRPTDRTGADYQLTFSVEDGPVNADVTLDLFQGRNRIAHAYARVGGPRIVFQRQRVIREAFDKALQQFEPQLPRVNAPGDRYRDDDGSNSNYNNNYNPNRPASGGYNPPPAYGSPDSNPYGPADAYRPGSAYPPY